MTILRDYRGPMQKIKIIKGNNLHEVIMGFIIFQRKISENNVNSGRENKPHSLLNKKE